MIIDLKKIKKRDVAAVGLKAFNLSRLHRLGIPVPTGFCITCQDYQDHLNTTNLRSLQRKIINWVGCKDLDSKSHALKKFREAIIAVDLSESLTLELVRHHRKLAEQRDMKSNLILAVRSSATAEDTTDHSFAGQYDSVLGARDIGECCLAIKHCWASIWTDRAVEYREQNGIGDHTVAMAVIVQILIPADASGVIFTVDPVHGNKNRMILESNYGLGSTLVSGKVSPDRMIISKADQEILEREIALKEIKMVVDGKGHIKEQSVDRELVDKASLDAEAAGRLCRYAQKAEKAFGYPLDIEWVLCDGNLSLIQARPVTGMQGLKSNEVKQVWSNVNAGEVLPDVVTPMTWSIIKPLVQDLLGQAFGQLGMELEGQPLIGLIGGRVYFNLNTLIACVRRIPGIGDKGYTRMFGGEQEVAKQLGKLDIPEEDIPDLKFRPLRVIVRLPWLVYKGLGFYVTKGDNIVRVINNELREEEKINVQELSDGDLVAGLKRRILDNDKNPDIFHFIGAAKSAEPMYYDLCKRWFGEQGGQIASRLLSGMGGNENTEAGTALWRIARIVHDDPVMKEKLLGSNNFLTLQMDLHADEKGNAFLHAWKMFMKDHGHHCRGELELMNRRWSESPNYILGQVKNIVRAMDKKDFMAHYKNVKNRRNQILTENSKKIRNPVTRMFFNFFTSYVHRIAPVKETIKSQLVRKLAMVRKMLLELGDRCAKNGILLNPEDIFFLHIHELQEILKTNTDGEKTKNLVLQRRETYEKNLVITPPPIVYGRFDPAAIEESTVEEDVKKFKGVSVHPGLVTGPARVILRAGDDAVQPGEILVAPFTDPGWTPYFLNASAIVMDTGGILSHGSIIAREYGIPAVVNVGPATRIIKTGQMIRVNGDQGTVTIIERQ